MQTLPLRILSALFALAILVGTVYFTGANGIVALVTLVVLLSTYELSKILYRNSVPNPTILRMAFVLCSFSVFLALSFFSHGEALSIIFLLCYVLGLLVFSAINTEKNLLLHDIAISALGILYLGWLPSFASRLVQVENGVFWFFALLTIVFFGDIAAYFVGSKLGKNYLIPSISPKKTREGGLGGLFASVIAGGVFAYFAPIEISLFMMLIMSLVMGIFGQAGDFFESLIKRVADVKDSGNLMPGHGGLLDRIDGLLFAAPVMFLFVKSLL